MSFWKKMLGPNIKEIWQQFSRDIGAELVEGKWGTNKVQARFHDLTITLDTFTVSTGKSSMTYTRLRAPFVNKEGFQFLVTRSGFFSELWKRWFHLQDIEVGHPEFDRAFIIRGNDEAKIRALFANPRVRELIQAQPQILFGVAHHQGIFAPKYPEGVHELSFVMGGIVTDIERLKLLFDLFEETLHLLCYADDAGMDEVPLLLEILLNPGGEIKEHTFVLWDGNAPRREAADRLGQLKNRKAVEPLMQVLNDADVTLREKASRALGVIGDVRAVPAVIPLLGDDARTAGGNFSSRSAAAAALRDLGRRELVEAFAQTLFRNKAAVEVLKKSHPREFGQAFLRALDSDDVTIVVNAAWALAELGGVEGLPRLRSKTGLLNFPNKQLREIWHQSIAKLTSLSSLPRSAEAVAPNVETLPRPAGEPEPSTETLPRAAKE